jgi:hypothetical protein
MNYWLSTSDSVGDGRNCEASSLLDTEDLRGRWIEENRFGHCDANGL